MTVFIGVGIRRKRLDQVLDVTFVYVAANPEKEIEAPILSLYGQSGTYDVSVDTVRDIVKWIPSLHAYGDMLGCIGQDENTNDYAQQTIVLSVYTDMMQPVETVEEGYFKLHLLSHRCVKPHHINLSQLFSILPNVAWTTQGPILPKDLMTQRVVHRTKNRELTVSHIDKFPYLVNYHSPSGVRIASGSQVRLGAYLSDGTTVMPAGYVNFNAGTLGASMVEGRISAGVMVGSDTDIGGGASIMGTLSGGNQHVISIGPQCLLGANAGLGISLGQGCTVEAGLYITAGKKISLVNEAHQPIDLEGRIVPVGDNIVKAAMLSGRDYLLFLQDSQTGHVLCRPNSQVIALNQQLHHNH